jgi:hypothetical protein
MDPEEIKRKEIERQEKKRRKQEDRLKKLEEKRKSLQDGKPINEGSTDSHVDGISNDDHMRDSSDCSLRCSTLTILLSLSPVVLSTLSLLSSL